MMKSIFTFIGAFACTSTFAGTYSDPVIEMPVIAAEDDDNGLLIPILIGVALAILLSGKSDSSTPETDQ
jgi:hypothetical protein